ncbi:ORF80 [Betabaculovirus altermyunipunctae]|uniref:ORF80 n=1 Tax=Betabaculovirus altermyunipunctae TaxID=3051996 RepID=A0A1S5YED6_9BBAC|nr:ORF80 [Betabaculovirus altermyunipunctae]AQQ80347.1 ORF80 [Betabaculovirus altermyunipunctae]
MLAKILLTLLLIGIVLLFVLNASREPEEEETEPEDFNCIIPDPDDCTSYINCLGAKIQCPAYALFDTHTMSCQYYFDVVCGSRPQPPDPTSREICAPYYSGVISGVQRFPMRHCRFYAECDIDNPQSLRQCTPQTNYNIVTESCTRHVDCGSRCVTCETPT